MNTLLEVRNLEVSFFTHAGEVKAVRGATFAVEEGEAVALVGESGCGKSVTAQAIMGLIPNPPGKVVSGSIIFNNENLVLKSQRDMENIRGKQIGMIFQDPMTSLNPTMTVGRQLIEGIIKHQRLSATEAMLKAVEMLRLVGIPQPDRRVKQYPHEFSGGMRQRVMIAMALACEPRLLIADEPTTALDVTIQAQIIELMKSLKEKIRTSIILITHDLGVVAGLCTRILVMYAGQIVEAGDVRDIFYQPQHPYTWSLLKAVPRLDAKEKTRLVSIPGQPPDLIQPPKGCSFAPRCEYAMQICLEQPPQEVITGDKRRVSCWLIHTHAPKVLLRGVR
ncbi:ABC transporter ATP-binding protein [Zhaonella formicivorans]|uniref:ABC transporter ATP-binding protein n=1 Tax=Zhaonella formicivorans TaxID=2528593 RepID=UPI0010D36248|nr:ABC transporter ATP-binding protein [Zhaonella formicivorans]